MSPRRGASALAVLLATAAACSSSDEASTPDVVLKPNVRILDAASLARIKTISSEGTIAFDGHDGAIDALVAGDVVAGAIAAAAPEGLLRRVTRAEKTEGGVVVDTTPATLVDAVERGKVRLVRPLVSADVKPADLGSGSLTGFYVGLNDVAAYPVVRVAVPITPAALSAKAKKLSK